MGADFRLGRWQDVLDGVELHAYDACIFDAPYGKRVHEGFNAMQATATSGFTAPIDYAEFSEEQVGELVESFSPRTRGWFVSITSHDLLTAWDAALTAAGRYVFPPLPYVDFGKQPRIPGDGPASWTNYIIVARPRSREFSTWGSLPGAYLRSKGDTIWKPLGGKPRIGGKPLGVMRRIVADYSRPGDLVCDPFGGHATTLLAALTEGRRAVGAEMDPEAHALGSRRLAAGYTPALFAPVSEPPEQREMGL